MATFSEKEVNLFCDLLNKSEEYFEYGCGLSTKFASESKVKKITAVDTSIEWVNKIKEEINDNRN